MRTALLALVLVSVACGRPDRDDTPSATDAASGNASTDQLALRFPRGGGRVRAYAYPALDSVVWTSTAAVPALGRVIAFDDEAGTVAAVDAKGIPIRLDLRLGGVGREAKPSLSRVVSADGSDIYGVAAGGKVARLAGAGEAWSFTPPLPAREVLPQRDGSVLVISDRGGKTTLWHLHPPEDRVLQSVELPATTKGIRAQAGDRVYFAVDSGLVGVKSGDLSLVPSVRLRDPVRSIAPTPSGDRIYVALDSAREIAVVDRYTEDVEERIELPGAAVELRMDPVGRFLLARPTEGDSAWVIAVGTERLLGAVPTAWRSDLPAVAPDGALALLRGKDVVLADGATLATRRRIAGGAADLWYFIAWSGFRPRTSPDEEPLPVVADSSDVIEENPFAGQIAGRDTLPAEAMPPEPAASPAPAAAEAATPPASRPPRAPEFTVQFGALRDEGAARTLAQQIRATGSARGISTTRVVTSTVAGSAIHRVVAGPFSTRADAERAGSESGKSYWVYEGPPE